MLIITPVGIIVNLQNTFYVDRVYEDNTYQLMARISDHNHVWLWDSPNKKTVDKIKEVILLAYLDGIDVMYMPSTSLSIPEEAAAADVYKLLQLVETPDGKKHFYRRESKWEK